MGGHDHGVEASSLIEEKMTNIHTSLLATCLGRFVNFIFTCFVTFFYLTNYIIVNSTENLSDAIIYSYTKNINGFAAQLEEEEANAIAST